MNTTYYYLMILTIALLLCVYSVYHAYVFLSKTDATTDYSVQKHADGRNDLDNIQLRKNTEQAKKTGQQIDGLQKLSSVLKTANSSDCTKDGQDMFASGSCHRCCQGEAPYLLGNTIICYTPQSKPTEAKTLTQDPCTCTKSGDDIFQNVCCFPCCDGMSYYKNKKDNSIHCFYESDQKNPDFEKITTADAGANYCSKIAPSDQKDKCPVFSASTYAPQHTTTTSE